MTKACASSALMDHLVGRSWWTDIEEQRDTVRFEFKTVDATKPQFKFIVVECRFHDVAAMRLERVSPSGSVSIHGDFTRLYRHLELRIRNGTAAEVAAEQIMKEVEEGRCL